MNEYYPRLKKFLGEKITAYIALLRPFTLLPPFLAGLFLIIAKHGVYFDSFTKGIYVGITLALAQACGQVINQVVDKDLDKIIKPYRPIPRGIVTSEEAVGVAWILALLAVARGFTVSIYFGLMTSLMLFFAVFYSLPPLSPRKINPWINHLWVSFSRSVLPLLAILEEKGFIYALLAFIWTFGWQTSKDVLDVEGDKMFGIKTIANTYGRDFVKKLALISSIVFVMISIAFNKMIMLTMIPLMIFGYTKFYQKSKTENIIGWAVFYIGLGMIFVLTAIDIFLEI